MPGICLSTKSWRSGSGWFAQLLALAIAEAGASIAFVAPLAEPAEREPAHPNLERLILPRECVGGEGWARRRLASARRVLAGVAALARLRFTTGIFMFSIAEPLVVSLPLFALLRLSGAQVILIVHDAEPHAWKLPPPLRFIERQALQTSYRLATRLVCLTHAASTVLAENFGIDRSRVEVIPHGAFPVPGVPPLPASRCLLAFGTIRRNKRLREVIEAILDLRRRGFDVRLVIAGEPDDDAYWRECRAVIARDPAGFSVRLGFLPEAELPDLLAGVDALVLAYEEFSSQSGVAVLAALAGRPVLSTGSGGLAELAARGLAVETIAGPVTGATVANAIVRFYERPVEEWRVAACTGRTSVAAALAWPAIGAAYVALARDLDGKAAIPVVSGRG